MAVLREYEIPDTGYYAVRYTDGQNVYQKIYTCETGEYIETVPANWDERELHNWGAAYSIGYKHGFNLGQKCGRRHIQNEILKVLGIYDRLRDLERNDKTIANVLYWHDGVCKDDIAGIAGKG